MQGYRRFDDRVYMFNKYGLGCSNERDDTIPERTKGERIQTEVGKGYKVMAYNYAYNYWYEEGILVDDGSFYICNN